MSEGTDDSETPIVPFDALNLSPMLRHFEELAKRQSAESNNQLERAKEVIVKVPLAHIRRMAQEKELGSYGRETQFFTDVTTMHGPLRVYVGRSFSGWFWGSIMTLSGALLLYQIITIASAFVARPVDSQVSFLIEEDGLDFPVVTVCNFNPIKKTFILEKNKTGNLPSVVVDYLLRVNVEMQALYSNSIKSEIVAENELYQEYLEKYDHDFTIKEFFWNGGFDCPEVMKLCSFGGRKFNCCAHVDAVLTPLGKCFSLNMAEYGQLWMKKQASAGEYNGLQIILDTHLEEQFATRGGNDTEENDPVFTNSFENGYRYYVHAPTTVSFVASEGISVSPGSRVYSSIISSNYDLLPKEEWGTCRRDWPKGYDTKLTYSNGNCAMLCKANFYQEKCGCTPYMYNLEFKHRSCTPLEMYTCMEKTKLAVPNGPDFELPICKECNVECESWQYHAYNSYGFGFSDGAIEWLQERNPELTLQHVRKNFLAVSVFFKDLQYTKYTQQKGLSISQILSDIGGNMGLCFGMSVITITEITIYFLKLIWITFSQKRRHYLNEKKKNEKEKEKRLSAVATDLNLQRHVAVDVEKF